MTLESRIKEDAASGRERLLVFHRKDLCDARPKLEMSSYFQMKCTDSHIPPT